MTILFALALAIFGSRVHWVEETGTAERDGFVAQAETLLDGGLPRDPFRGLLYPLLIAGLAKLLGDPFLAARLLTNLAAVGLVGLAFGFGSRFGGPGAGLWALLLTAANPNLWILGQHVSTDMLFAALGGLSWLAALRYMEQASGSARGHVFARYRWALLAGAALGLAYFTRTTALFLAPGLLLAWWWGSDETARRRPVALVVALSAALVAALPHWLLRAAAFGNPFYDENWKNLAFKLYGFPDWSYLDRVPFGSLAEVVRHDPGLLLAGLASELVRFARGGLFQLLGTPLHVLLLLPAVWLLYRRVPRRVLWALLTCGIFICAVALVFFAWGRLLLVVLPLLNGLLAAGWCETAAFGPSRTAAAPRGRLERLRAVALATWVLAGVAGLLAVKTFGFRLPAFVGRHPYGEIALLRRLDGELGPGAVLAGTTPFLGRYVEHDYLYVGEPAGEEITQIARYWRRLAGELESRDVRFLVVGRDDLRTRPEALLGEQAPVPWLVSEGCEGGVCLWRLERDRLGTAATP